MKLRSDFFARKTQLVAEDLVGCTLATAVRGSLTSGRIVEVEAYTGPHDPAAHGYRERRTKRNASMFGPPGMTYVYFIYGMHWCFNAVTEREHYPAAVLIRALEPTQGLEEMALRRGVKDEKQLCSGPAKLCQALAIDRSLDGKLMPSRAIWMEPSSGPKPEVDIGPRVGISKAADWPLRFVESGSRWVSK